MLVDWAMPGMDGLSFVKAYRQLNATTPIILLATENDKSRVVEAIKAG